MFAFAFCALGILISMPIPVPVRVEIRSVDGRWELWRGGKPYWIQGAAGDHSLRSLKAAGGNSTRTWGAEELPAKLAEAEKEGLTVTAGVWLGHKRHHFDYGDAASVARQFSDVKKTVLAHRRHPALLFWALGNEMEVDNDNPLLWKAVGELAVMVKALDPDHPVMTVVAEVSEDKIRNIQKYAPEIDVLGINSYGGLPSLPERLAKAGWKKPYVITEFGPLGPWESGRTEWGAAIEATSTEKARFYAANYDASIRDRSGWCLGSYAFLWGHKQETTPTWFGLHLPSGESLAALDELILRWTGHWPKNRSPRIDRLEWEAFGKRVDPGSAFTARLEALDPDGDPIQVNYEVRREIEGERPTGEGERGPEVLPGYPKTASGRNFTVMAPRVAGPYRLYVTVLDGRGKAATANAPFFVK